MADYRKLFPLKPLLANAEDLDYLATMMSGHMNYADRKGVVLRFVDSLWSVIWGTLDAPEPIPAGYTYLGQFIIHDISKMERSDRHVQSHLPWNADPDPDYWKTLRNLHEANFNLETVYGNQVMEDNEWLTCELIDHNAPLPFLKLGSTKGTKSSDPTAPHDPTKPWANSYPCDLDRDEDGHAITADDRNDENLILAQTLVAFIKFHNALVVRLSHLEAYKGPGGNYKKNEIFKKARELNIRYYQTIILRDFLPRIVRRDSLVKAYKRVNSRASCYQPTSDKFIPLEFSTAAFRFGHSMIRPSYKFNLLHPSDERISVLQQFGGKRLASEWIIDWNLFYEIDDTDPNVAVPIDTVLPTEMLTLRPKLRNPEGDFIVDPRATSIAALDYFRAQQLFLTSGQRIADVLGVKKIDAASIAAIFARKVMVGSETNPDGRDFTKSDHDLRKKHLAKVFGADIPIWFYILAEAELQNNGKLGSIGGRIVAETVTQLIYNSDYSVLKKNDWEVKGIDLLKDRKFSMPLMLKTIRDTRLAWPRDAYPPAGRFDEINPMGKGPAK